MTGTPEPMVMSVATTLTLDTIVGADYHQINEDGDYSASPVTLLDMIVNQTARQLVAQIVRDETRFKGVRATVREQLEKAIGERIAPMLDEAFAGPIPKTNGYGEQHGTTTLRELVIEVAHSKLARSGRSSYDKTPLDKALEEATTAIISKELAEEVAAVKAQIRSAVKSVATEHLTVALAKQLGVEK
jgi:hypothetical protein